MIARGIGHAVAGQRNDGNPDSDGRGALIGTDFLAGLALCVKEIAVKLMLGPIASDRNERPS